MNTLFNNNNKDPKPDICLISKDGEKLYLHSIVLRIWSPIFAELFEDNFKRNDSGLFELEIPDYKHTSLTTFFQSIYSLPFITNETLSLNTKNIMEVTFLSHLYSVEPIKNRCITEIREMVSKPEKSQTDVCDFMNSLSTLKVARESLRSIIESVCDAIIDLICNQESLNYLATKLTDNAVSIIISQSSSQPIFENFFLCSFFYIKWISQKNEITEKDEKIEEMIKWDLFDKFKLKKIDMVFKECKRQDEPWKVFSERIRLKMLDVILKDVPCDYKLTRKRKERKQNQEEDEEDYHVNKKRS